jgi:hypothetical protein
MHTDPDNLTAKCSRVTHRDFLTDVQEAMPAAVGARHAAAQYLKVQQLSFFACLCESSDSVSELRSGMLLLPKCYKRM